jgi:hypothetical protein
MVVAEVLAGISLIKAGVDFVKSNIETAQDIGNFAEAIDNVFRGKDEVDKARNKKSGVGGVGDQLGIKSVAQEMIDAKLAEEKMEEMRSMLNMRFGPDTWQQIVDERSRRIAEIKDAQKRARIEKRRKDAELWQLIQQGLIVFAVFVVAVFAFAYVAVIR